MGSSSQGLITRHQVRELVEHHARMQYAGEHDGRRHAVANDVGDEVSAVANEELSIGGHAAAQRFGRLYAEEQLAFERDLRASPRQMSLRVFGDIYRAKTGREPVPLISGPAAVHRGWIVLLVIVAGLIVLL